MAVDKATAWQLSGPEPAQDVAIVATGLDGTTMPLVGEAYQEARCGTVALDDQEGERLTTAYLGALPEAFLWLDQCLQNREPGKMLVDKETVFCLENILRRAIYGAPAQLREIDQLRGAGIRTLDKPREAHSLAAAPPTPEEKPVML